MTVRMLFLALLAAALTAPGRVEAAAEPSLEPPAAPVADGEGRRPDLPRFLERLDRLEDGSGERVAVGVFGASHIEGQKLTDHLRRRLGARYGKGGRGFIDPRPAGAALSPGRIGRRVSGPHEWIKGNHRPAGDELSLSLHKLRLLPTATFTLQTCRRCPPEERSDPGSVEVQWIRAPTTAAADVFINDVWVGELTGAPQTALGRLRVHVEGKRHEVEVRVRPDQEGALDLLALVQERATGGVVVDALGLTGATGPLFGTFDAPLLQEQVRARNYDLVVFAWGTNEVGTRNLDEARYRAGLRRSMVRVLEAAPQADCVYFGPTDRLVKRGDRWVPAPAYAVVTRVQQELSAELGCTWFDPRAAMGGPGSMARWQADGLALDDGTHLTGLGYRRLAGMLLRTLHPELGQPRRRMTRAQARRLGP